MKEIIITESTTNQRLDKFLFKLLPNATSSFIYKMLRKKNIVLNGKKATGNEKLLTGDSVKIFFSDDTYNTMAGLEKKASEYALYKDKSFGNVHIISETEDYLILNKPANVLSQKASNEDYSLNEEIIAYLINTEKITEAEFELFHPSVANRLDRNTTGIILAGKTLKGQQFLSTALNDRTVKKLYHTIVKGRIDADFTVKGFVIKDEASNSVKILENETKDSKYIETAFKVIKASDEYTLLEAHLITGRTHQIRASLSYYGHPILLDPKYGDRELNRKLIDKYHYKYQLLHAYSLTFADGQSFLAEEPEIYRKIMGEI